MPPLLAQISRDYRSYFQTPLGWIICALALAGSGAIFALFVLHPGQAASLTRLFTYWWTILGILAPAVAMRSFSEELRTGTFEVLMSSPLSELSLSLGKFVSGLFFLLTALAPTLLYIIVLESVARPEYGPILIGYLGTILLISTYVSVGVFFSSLTANQALAYLLALFVLFVVDVLAQTSSGYLPDPLNRIVASLSISSHAESFAVGKLDSADAAFFVVVSAWFIAMTAMVLRIRRWR